MTIKTADLFRVTTKAIGGGIEGAERSNRETASWSPAVISPDRKINPVKEMADARSADMVQNDGYAMGAMHTHKDSIVGAQYRLNAQPNWAILGADETWAQEFQETVEGRFNLMADSHSCWFDAQRKNTFTGLIRLGVGQHMLTGEVLATAEWIRQVDRPFKTAVQMIAPTRLSNPDMRMDDRTLRRGIEIDQYGAAQGYHFRMSYPNDFFDFTQEQRWRYVPAKKPWGRAQVIHIIEQMQPEQTRGVSDMVSVLKQMKMTKQFNEIVLQNAVVNASYAAAIESELPKEMVFGALGAGQAGLSGVLQEYLKALGSYTSTSDNIAIDGVRIPHLFPGTKLNLKPMGTPGGVGTDYENSLLRHIAAALGLSFEEFSKDYTKTNYSSARASRSDTGRYMQARKKVIADRWASAIFALWFEEEWNAGNIPVPRGKSRSIFYDPVFREALLQCEWIGSSMGQIDELKETQAAIMKIKSGLSTFEKECARLGEDFRRVFTQRAREEAMLKKLGLSVDLKGTKPGANDAQQTMRAEETEEE